MLLGEGFYGWLLLFCALSMRGPFLGLFDGGVSISLMLAKICSVGGCCHQARFNGGAKVFFKTLLVFFLLRLGVLYTVPQVGVVM